ncbi:MAG: DUF2934 domain-containing protein [Acidobacteria bacterium]|nr:DUF2934 domain-containing protein [Acidobacteriota bacterium]
MARKQASEKPLAVSPAAAAPAPARRKSTPPRTTRRAVETSTTANAAAPVTVEPVLAAPVPAAPSREQIARLAYSFWEARGYQGGSPEEDWIRAERMLAAKSAE